MKKTVNTIEEVFHPDEHAPTADGWCSVVKVGNESDHRALPPSLAAQNRSGMLGELNPLSEIQLPAAGSGLELQVEHLQMLAENDPERVSEVIKQWIGRNESSFPSAN